MVRFSDAQEGRKEAMRVGMLNVWDARFVGENALQEGKRYLVSPNGHRQARQLTIPGEQPRTRAEWRLESTEVGPP